MRKVFILLIAVAAVIAIVTTCSSQPGIREDVVRLHILANSDSLEDQSTKLWVRDFVLSNWGGKLSGFDTASAAWDGLKDLVPDIQTDVNRALKANDIAYTATVETGVFDFPDRQYNGIDFPAGKYEALRIKLGKADGKNWWCVMFPPLCLVGADSQFDLEKYSQMVQELEKNGGLASADGKKIKLPEAPVRFWLFDKAGGSKKWDKDFYNWVKEFWLSGDKR